MASRPVLLLAASMAALAAGLAAVMLRPAAAVDEHTVGAPDGAGDVGLHLSLALDANGHPAISYYDATNGDLKLLRCDDPACTGGGERIVAPDTEGDTGRATSLALDAGGRPVVSYKGPEGELKLLHCGDPDCESGNGIVAVDGAPPVHHETSLVLDEAGHPAIAYQSADKDHLVVVRCDDADCASASVATPDTRAFLGAYARIVLDADDNPVVAYRDATSDDLKVVHCGNPTCTEGNTTTAPATSGNIGVHISLQLDGEGLPVISYREGNAGTLQLMYCGDLACSDGNVDVSLFGVSGWSTSLQLDGDGLPVVASFGRYRLGVDVLRCADPLCDDHTVEQLATTDAPPFEGHHVALALDAAGLPIVAYYDATEGDLRVAHCADAACAGKPPTPVPTPPRPPGDVDCDFVVSSADATLTLQIAAGLLTPPACSLDADVNGDGVLTSVDAALVLQFAAGLLPDL